MIDINHNVQIESAPIAGYTDLAFRRVLREQGAKLVYTEMVSATALFHGSIKTKELLRKDDGPTAVQLFGKTPEHFAAAIKSGLLDDFCEININMGCPARKIVSNSEGAALMKNLPLAKQIIDACVGATDKPVTVKMRLGFLIKDGNRAVELAKICEASGVSRVIIHGRWAEQGYSGVANWEEIAKVVQAVKIPVVANGDVVDLESAKKCLRVTGAPGVMIARATLGAPWKIALKPIPSKEEVKEIIRTHIKYVLEEKGEMGFAEMKKHLLLYCNHLGITKESKCALAVSRDFGAVRVILGL